MEKMEIDTDAHIGVAYAQSLEGYGVIDSPQKCEEVFSFLTTRFRTQSLQALAILYRLSLVNTNGFGVQAYVLHNLVEKTQGGASQTKEFEIHAWLYSLGLGNFIVAEMCRKKHTDHMEPFVKLNHEAVGKWAEAEMLKFLKDDQQYIAFLDKIQSMSALANNLDDYERVN